MDIFSLDSDSREQLYKMALDNPKGLSFSYALKEDMVEELKDYLDWNGVSARSEFLSEDFLYKYIDRINLYNLIFTRELSGKFLYNIVNELINQNIGLDLILLYQKVDEFYIDKLKMIKELRK